MVANGEETWGNWYHNQKVDYLAKTNPVSIVHISLILILLSFLILLVFIYMILDLGEIRVHVHGTRFVVTI